jgi:uncharacterized membrane protein
MVNLSDRVLNDKIAALDSILIGVATGGRTSVGLAALAFTAPAGSSAVATKPLTWFQARWSKQLQAAALAGELVVDKLPSTPSRLKAGPLGARTATGSTAAAALAQRNGTDVGSASLLGGVGALVGSVLGARWRRRAAKRQVADFGPAIAEDVLSLALAFYACRRKPAPEVIDLTTDPATARRRDGADDGFAAQPQVN